MDEVKFDGLTTSQMAEKLYNDNYDTNSHPHSVKQRQSDATFNALSIAINNMNKYGESSHHNQPRYVYWWKVKNILYKKENDLNI